MRLKLKLTNKRVNIKLLNTLRRAQKNHTLGSHSFLLYNILLIWLWELLKSKNFKEYVALFVCYYKLFSYYVVLFVLYLSEKMC